uniref:Uncharacterized protein n=1 Tax=Oryza barthii TaxID=65489 RepID=A0A0D3ETR1_9ORYZ
MAPAATIPTGDDGSGLPHRATATKLLGGALAHRIPAVAGIGGMGIRGLRSKAHREGRRQPSSDL